MAGMKEAEEGIAREKIRDIKDIKIIVNLIVKASILDQLFFFFFGEMGGSWKILNRGIICIVCRTE